MSFGVLEEALIDSALNIWGQKRWRWLIVYGLFAYYVSSPIINRKWTEMCGSGEGGSSEANDEILSLRLIAYRKFPEPSTDVHYKSDGEGSTFRHPHQPKRKLLCLHLATDPLTEFDVSFAFDCNDSERASLPLI